VYTNWPRAFFRFSRVTADDDAGEVEVEWEASGVSGGDEGHWVDGLGITGASLDKGTREAKSESSESEEEDGGTARECWCRRDGEGKWP
jgi:hypothetical protein